MSRARARAMGHRSSAEDFAADLAPGGPADARYEELAGMYVCPRNVVTKVRISRCLDIRKISATQLNSYIPSMFWAMIVRMMVSGLLITCLQFSSGRLVLVGARSVPQTYQAAHKQRLKYAVSYGGAMFREFRVVNHVYNYRMNLGHDVDIAGIHREFQELTDWLPEDFPGGRMWMRGATMRFFASPELVGMGLKRPYQFGRVFGAAIEIAKRFPEYHLPESGERYEFLRRGHRKNLIETATRALEREYEDSDSDEEDERSSPLPLPATSGDVPV